MHDGSNSLRLFRTLFDINKVRRTSLLMHFLEGDDPDLRTNPFQEEGNDEDLSSTRAWNADPIQVPVGPVTRARAKKFKNALSGLIQGIWVQAYSWRPMEGMDLQKEGPSLVNVIQVKEDETC
ncbi:hypothetical protein ACOSP7_019113 [Xanthoceras sorbifolium]